VVRIVLSGHAELESALRTVPVAHQFLLKPCDPQVLERVVQRACDLQALINNDAIRRFVSGVQTLPALPHIYVKLTGLLESERSGVAEIARVIEQDPAMCAKILQLVNSSFIGLGRTISDVEQAVSYLGLNLLKNLTLVVQVFNVRPLSEAHRLQVFRLQRHGLLVGGIARRLVAEDQRASDDAFMAGILHDIGKLVLLDHQPDLYDLVQKKARLAHRPVHEVEREVLGVTHAEIGGFLLGLWGLPYPIVEAAANHHEPGRVHDPGVDVLMAVYVSNHLARGQEQACGLDETAQSPLDKDYLAAAGATDRLEEWRAIAAAQLGDSRGEQWAEGSGEQAA
jgi:HD-like signal output (HDOD) protein